MNETLPIVAKSLKDIVAEEYKRCSVDTAYFLKKYAKIQHPVSAGKIPFILFPFQEKTLEEIKKNRYNLILKSRQLGLSTLTAGYALWRILFKSDQNILVIATVRDVAKNMITKIRVMYDNLPGWLKTVETENNKMSLALSNGSIVKAISSSPTAGRSEALSLLILDEAAFIEYIDEIWVAAQQTLATGGDCIVLSTPNGIGNWFHKMWTDAEDGINGFATMKLPWYVHPERDQMWRDEQDLKLGKRKAAQECDADFLTSGNTVVDMGILQFYKATHVAEPKEKSGIDNGLWIWDYPDYTKAYVISADVARGDGSDFSAAQVFDVENVIQVAEYRGKIDTRAFGRLLASLGITYNNAMIVVERENLGWGTLQEIINLNYPNVFYSTEDLKYVDTTHQIKNKIHREEKKMKPGFATTMRTRPLLISKVERYFLDREIIVRSIRTINELETFIWKDGRAEAMTGRNDDLVMSLGILLWVRDTALKLKTQGIELTKIVLGRIGKVSYDGVYKSTDLRVNPFDYGVGKTRIDLKEYL